MHEQPCTVHTAYIQGARKGVVIVPEQPSAAPARAQSGSRHDRTCTALRAEPPWARPVGILLQIEGTRSASRHVSRATEREREEPFRRRGTAAACGATASPRWRHHLVGQAPRSLEVVERLLEGWRARIGGIAHLVAVAVASDARQLPPHAEEMQKLRPRERRLLAAQPERIRRRRLGGRARPTPGLLGGRHRARDVVEAR